MSDDPRTAMEEQLQAALRRIERLERTLIARGVLLASDESGIVTPQPPAIENSPTNFAGPAASEPMPPPSFSRVTSGPEPLSLESRVGSQWFNRLGILAMLIGVGWFLKLAFDNGWIGPVGHVLVGLAGGAGLIAWSERFQRKGFAAFSYSLKALGSGILYLSLWAAFSYYSLIPAGVAFAAMIVVTAFNGFLSWKQDAELLALYAIAGGLGTPILVSTGGNHEVSLFTYLLIQDLAVLVLVAVRPWSRLAVAAFLGTALYVAGWWLMFYNAGQAGRTAAFVAGFFLLFALAPRLVRLPDTAEPRAWDNLALLVLPLANAALAFLAFYSILNPVTGDRGGNWSGAWLAVGFAAFYLGLLRLPERGFVRPPAGLVNAVHLSAAVVFLTLAIPLKTQGRWMTIGFLAEGVVLLALSVRLRSLLVRGFAVACLVMGVCAVLVVNPSAGEILIFNQRFATYLFAVAALACTAWIATRQLPGVGDEDSTAAVLRWAPLQAASVLAANALALLALSMEIHHYWARLRPVTGPGVGDFAMYEQFSYSALFMAYGAALLSAGFWKRSAFFRWQGLALLAVSIAKVFLLDESQLSRGFRVLSFLVLGALLLAVSYAYQRDWLRLPAADRRGGGEPE